MTSINLRLCCLILSSSLVASQNTFWPRDSYVTADTNVAPPTVSGRPVYTSGAASVATQLKTDANAAIAAFTDAIGSAAGDANTQSSKQTAQLFQTIVKGAMSYPLNQNFGTTTTPSQARLDAMASTINNTLNSINNVADKLLSESGGALHFDDLKECISGLVQKGGLQTGESCVINGMSVTGVSDMMASVLHTFGNGAIPTEVLSQTSQALDPTFTAILPGEQKFYDSVNSAITSVQASVTGELVAALNSAQTCFQEAMSKDATYEDKMAYTQSCNRKTDGASVYNSMKTLYLSITNQMVGYLQPNVIDSIHTIADNYLNPDDPASDEAYFRSAIANTTSSIVASNAGNQVTYAYKLSKCLDAVVGTSDPQAASKLAEAQDCLKKPDGPAASVKEIVYGYIQQIYGVLPSQLAAKIEATGVANLDPSDSDYGTKVQALHETFEQTNPGPEYVTCYETFVNCLFNNANGALTVPGNTQSVCLLGDACQKTPDGLENNAVHIGKRSNMHQIVPVSRRATRTQSARSVPLVQRVRIVRKHEARSPSHLLRSYEKFFGTRKSN